MLPHLDIEGAQHSIDAEQILDGGIYVAVQCCVGDWGPQDAKGPVQEPQARLHFLGLLQSLARINKGNSLIKDKVQEKANNQFLFQNKLYSTGFFFFISEFFSLRWLRISVIQWVLTVFFSQTSQSTVVWGTVTDSDKLHPSRHDF